MLLWFYTNWSMGDKCTQVNLPTVILMLAGFVYVWDLNKQLSNPLGKGVKKFFASHLSSE